MTAIFTNPTLQAIDANGDVLPGARLFFFAAGTTTPQAVFSDDGLTTPLPNPMTANSTGTFADALGNVQGIFLSEQPYRIRLTDADGAVIWEIDDYLPGSGTGGSAFFGIESIADLTAISKQALLDRQPSLVTSSDGGTFVWDDASTTPEDQWRTFEADEGGAGRWERVEEQFATNRISARAFGMFEGMNSDTFRDRLEYALAETGQAGLVLTIPEWTQIVADSIDIETAVMLDMTPKTRLIFPPSTRSKITSGITSSVDGFAFTAHGTLGGTSALTANALRGSRTLPVADASGFAIGDVIMACSDLQFQDDTAQRLGEIATIRDISGNDIIIERPLRYGFLTSDGAFVRKLNMLEDIYIQGGIIECDRNLSGSFSGRNGAIDLAFVRNAHLRNVKGEGWRNTAFQYRALLEGSASTRALNIIGDFVTEDDVGYANKIQQGTRGLLLYNCHARRCGKLLDAGAGLGGSYGTPIENRMVNSYGEHIFRQVISTHAACGSLWIDRVAGYSRQAPRFRGHDLMVTNCDLEWKRTDGLPGRGIQINAVNREAGYHIFRNNRFRNWNASVSDSNGVVHIRGLSAADADHGYFEWTDNDAECLTGHAIRIVASQNSDIERIVIRDGRAVTHSTEHAALSIEAQTGRSIRDLSLQGGLYEAPNSDDAAVRVNVGNGASISGIMGGFTGRGGAYGYRERYVDNPALIDIRFSSGAVLSGAVANVLWASGMTDSALPGLASYPGLANGNLDHWQRGTSFTVSSTSGIPSADLWSYRQSGGADGVTVSRVAGDRGRYAMRLLRAPTDTETGSINILSYLTTEDARKWRGRRGVARCRVRVGAGFSGTSVSFRGQSNANENQDLSTTSGSNLGVIFFTPGTDWKDVEFPIAVPDDASTLALFVRMGAVAANPGADDWIEIEQVHITPPVNEKAADQGGGASLARCMRSIIAGTVRSENGSRWVSFPQKMRDVPSVSVSAGSAGNISDMGFELTHTSAANVTYTASTGVL